MIDYVINKKNNEKKVTHNTITLSNKQKQGESVKILCVVESNESNFRK